MSYAEVIRMLWKPFAAVASGRALGTVRSTPLVRLAALLLIAALTLSDHPAQAQDEEEELPCITWGDECELCIDDSCEECPGGRSCIRMQCAEDEDEDDEEDEGDSDSGVCSPD